MTALAARGIRKSFGRRRVLTGLDLEVTAGELVAVVGENGTGKTTLLRILAGDLRPDAGTLSGGTRQKLSLTLALMHDPPVLLLDEPYQGFDWQTYLAFWDLAGELRDRGTATVVISHLVFEQERFDRICHLRDGRIEEEVVSHAPAA